MKPGLGLHRKVVSPYHCCLPGCFGVAGSRGLARLKWLCPCLLLHYSQAAGKSLRWVASL